MNMFYHEDRVGQSCLSTIICGDEEARKHYYSEMIKVLFDNL